MLYYEEQYIQTIKIQRTHQTLCWEYSIMIVTEKYKRILTDEGCANSKIFRNHKDISEMLLSDQEGFGILLR